MRGNNNTPLEQLLELKERMGASGRQVDQIVELARAKLRMDSAEMQQLVKITEALQKLASVVDRFIAHPDKITQDAADKLAENFTKITGHIQNAWQVVNKKISVPGNSTSNINRGFRVSKPLKTVSPGFVRREEPAATVSPVVIPPKNAPGIAFYSDFDGTLTAVAGEAVWNTGIPQQVEGAATIEEAKAILKQALAAHPELRIKADAIDFIRKMAANPNVDFVIVSSNYEKYIKLSLAEAGLSKEEIDAIYIFDRNTQTVEDGKKESVKVHELIRSSTIKPYIVSFCCDDSPSARLQMQQGTDAPNVIVPILGVGEFNWKALEGEVDIVSKQIATNLLGKKECEVAGDYFVEDDYSENTLVSNGMLVGSCEIEGIRYDTQQDTIVFDASPQTYAFSAILDETQQNAVMGSTFAKLQEKCGMAGQGSTACVATGSIQNNKVNITTSFVGDSIAYLIVIDKDGNPVRAVPCNSKLHDANNVDEVAAIAAGHGRAKGAVSDGYLQGDKNPSGHVNGVAVTRAIGDNQFEAYGLLHTPEIMHTPHELKPGEQAFMVVACDGASEHFKLEGKNVATLSAQQIGKLFSEKLIANRNTPPAELAEAVIAKAFNLPKGIRSTDNISVMVAPLTEGKAITAAVFDGHGGSDVAQALKKNFSNCFSEAIYEYINQEKLAVTAPMQVTPEVHNAPAPEVHRAPTLTATTISKAKLEETFAELTRIALATQKELGISNDFNLIALKENQPTAITTYPHFRLWFSLKEDPIVSELKQVLENNQLMTNNESGDFIRSGYQGAPANYWPMATSALLKMTDDDATNLIAQFQQKCEQFAVKWHQEINPLEQIAQEFKDAIGNGEIFVIRTYPARLTFGTHDAALMKRFTELCGDILSPGIGNVNANDNTIPVLAYFKREAPLAQIKAVLEQVKQEQLRPIQLNTIAQQYAKSIGIDMYVIPNKLPATLTLAMNDEKAWENLYKFHKPLFTSHRVHYSNDGHPGKFRVDFKANVPYEKITEFLQNLQKVLVAQQQPNNAQKVQPAVTQPAPSVPLRPVLPVATPNVTPPPGGYVPALSTPPPLQPAPNNAQRVQPPVTQPAPAPRVPFRPVLPAAAAPHVAPPPGGYVPALSTPPPLQHVTAPSNAQRVQPPVVQPAPLAPMPAVAKVNDALVNYFDSLFKDLDRRTKNQIEKKLFIGKDSLTGPKLIEKAAHYGFENIFPKGPKGHPPLIAKMAALIELQDNLKHSMQQSPQLKEADILNEFRLNLTRKNFKGQSLADVLNIRRYEAPGVGQGIKVFFKSLLAVPALAVDLASLGKAGAYQGLFSTRGKGFVKEVDKIAREVDEPKVGPGKR